MDVQGCGSGGTTTQVRDHEDSQEDSRDKLQGVDVQRSQGAVAAQVRTELRQGRGEPADVGAVAAEAAAEVGASVGPADSSGVGGLAPRAIVVGLSREAPQEGGVGQWRDDPACVGEGALESRPPDM